MKLSSYVTENIDLFRSVVVFYCSFSIFVYITHLDNESWHLILSEMPKSFFFRENPALETDVFHCFDIHFV